MKRSFQKSNNQQKFYINAKIVSTKLKINEGILSSNFIVYVIKVITSYGKWFIEKRYSDFENLNNSLKFNDLNKLFPPKRLFKNSESIVEERIKKFNNYLFFLLYNYDILKYPILITFFKIKDEIIDLYLKNSLMTLNEYGIEQNHILSKSLQINFSNSLHFSNDNYFILYEDYKTTSEDIIDKTQINHYVIEEFLRNLDSKIENMGEIVKTFLAYLRYENKWKKLSKDDILKLFIGGNITNIYFENDINNIPNSNVQTQNSTFISNDSINENSCFNSNLYINNNSYVRGLFYHIGNFNINYLGSVSCLNLLCELLNIEKNPDGELYKKIFRLCKFESFELMNLIEFSKIKNYSNENICFEIIKIYFNINDELDINFYKIYENDKEFINRFEIWNKKQIQL